MMEQKNSREKRKGPEREITKNRTRRVNNNTDTQNNQKQLIYRGKEKIAF